MQFKGIDGSLNWYTIDDDLYILWRATTRLRFICQYKIGVEKLNHINRNSICPPQFRPSRCRLCEQPRKTKKLTILTTSSIVYTLSAAGSSTTAGSVRFTLGILFPTRSRCEHLNYEVFEALMENLMILLRAPLNKLDL